MAGSAAGAIGLAFRDDTLDRVADLMGSGGKDPVDSAQDEEFWGQIQQAFSLDRNIVNFNNGGCSPSPRIVQEALKRQLDYSNQAPSYFMWQHLEPEIESVRKGLARVFGCDSEEIAITRNASESLETCLLGMDLAAGDEVLCSSLDYPRMVTSIAQRSRRFGTKMVQVHCPTPPQRPDELVKAYESGITNRTKLILVPQVAFCNGQIFPVREIVALGRKRGIPVIVDGAHAFAQFPFKRDDLGCDFYGTSLHKWLMAPIGTGFLYIKKERISEVWSLLASEEKQTKDIRKFEEIGTHPAANHNVIGEALTFHELIGVERKAARLRYLRRRWTDRLQGEKKVKWFTNLAPDQSCGLTVVGIEGIKTADLGSWLMTKHNIYVVGIQYGGTIDGIRVTPNVYSTIEEVDRFGDAMVHAAKHGIG